MTEPAASPLLDARVADLERRLARWRRLALGAAALLLLAGVLGFQRAAPGPLEGTRLTLHGPRGGTVVLSLRSAGVLEAKFAAGAASGPNQSSASALVIVSPEGREIVRLGEPTARPLAP